MALSSRGTKLESFLRSAVARGLTANQTLASLRLANQGYTRSTFLRDFAQIRGIDQASERLKFIRRDLRPDPRAIPEAVTRQLRRYNFVMEIRGSDLETGASVTQNISISSSSVLSIEELEDDAISIMSDPGQYGRMHVEQALLVSATRAGEQGAILSDDFL